MIGEEIGKTERVVLGGQMHYFLYKSMVWSASVSERVPPEAKNA